MALPKAVQAQLDEADQIQKKLKVVEAPAENAENTTTDDPFNADADTETTGEQQAAPPAPAEEVAPEPPKPQEDPFKAKYDVLRGKYEAEVPRLHQQNRELSQKLEELSKKIEELTKKPEQPAASLVTDKDVEEYGDELIGLARRIAQEEFSRMAQPLYARLQQQLAPMLEQVKQTQQDTAVTREELYYRDLATQVPDWKVVNVDEGFLKWLAQPVSEFTDDTRQDALNKAYNRLDAAATAKLMIAYKEATGATAAPQENPLQRQAAPAKSGASAAAPTSKRIWSQADYARAWDHRLARTMSNDEIEKLRAEADKALVEGRVR